MGSGFVVTGLSESVGVILAAQALIGFGWTFKSGAIDAWLADEIGQERLGGAYQRGSQAARIASLAGIGAGVGLATVDLALPVVIGGVVLITLGLALAVLMPETGFDPVSRGETPGADSMWATARRGTHMIRGHTVLLLIVVITFLGGMSAESFDRLWEAHLLVDVGVPGLGELDPVLWFGVINAVALLLAIAVAQPLVKRFERLSLAGMARTLLAFDALALASVLAFAVAGSFGPAILCFWAARVAYSLGSPVYMTWLNGNIDDSSARATVISMTNVGHSVGEAGGGPILGAVGNGFGIPVALAAGALVFTPALALYGRAIRHHGREPELAAVGDPAG
jgi:DHA3 family tetracycline resistance protein-like MFS transporter